MNEPIAKHNGVTYHKLKDLEPWSFLPLFSTLSESPTYTSWTYQIFLDDPNDLCFAAVFDHKLVGCCLAFYDFMHECFNIGAIVVDEQYQNRGIAGHLFDLVKASILENHEFAVITLETEAHNEKAIRFYAKKGFIAVARTAIYYVNSSDAIMMKTEIRR